LRERVRKSVAGRARPTPWNWLPMLATAAVAIVVAALWLASNRQSSAQLASELADQHIATLASANPVDVISTDRHTVKPWFEGKIPFTFNLPELQNSAFSLAGGKVTYLRQAPGAELVYRIRQHQISVFVFQQKALGSLRSEGNLQKAPYFGMRTWNANGLQYFVIGDAGPQDLDNLAQLLRSVN